MSIKVGVAGVGAIGQAVCKALTTGDGIAGLSLDCISDTRDVPTFDVPKVSLEELAGRVDLIVECLPARTVPMLADEAFHAGKDMVVISSAALLLMPEILNGREKAGTRIFVPSGALGGLDGVKAMKEMGIKSSQIASIKPPKGFSGAPFIVEEGIDLDGITEKTLLFKGNALDAAKGFPANVNVAATLSLAGIGGEHTMVEIWADPEVTSNSHEISVSTEYSTLKARIENMPDPANPKSSVLAAQSIVACLRDMRQAVVIG